MAVQFANFRAAFVLPLLQWQDARQACKRTLELRVHALCLSTIAEKITVTRGQLIDLGNVLLTGALQRVRCGQS